MDPVLFFSICASLEAVERRHRIGKTQLIQKVAKLWMLTALSCGFVEFSQVKSKYCSSNWESQYYWGLTLTKGWRSEKKCEDLES